MRKEGDNLNGSEPRHAEGNISVVKCPTDESYHAELKNMAEFYGLPPPAFVTVDYPSGKITKYYDERPI